MEQTDTTVLTELKVKKDVYLDLRVKKILKTASMPKYAHNGDAGLDLTATSKSFDKEGNVVYGTGLAFQIPRGYVGLLFPRSSNANKDILLSNSVGVIDSIFRGEVMLKFKPLKKGWFKKPKTYNIGDKIGQLIVMPYPKVTIREVPELSKTNRGAGGYGSTGK